MGVVEDLVTKAETRLAARGESGLLTDYVQAAIDFVETETDIHVLSVADEVRYFDGGPFGRTLLILPESYATITLVEERDSTSAFSTVDSGDYVFADRVLQRINGAFPAGLRNIRLTYSAGYASLSLVPHRVTSLLLDLVGVGYRTRKTATPSLLPDGQIIPADRIPSGAKKTLDELAKWRA